MVAARIASELILEMQYKLRMLGVPVEGPAMLLGNNMSVILSTTIPSLVLKKKHQAICYHHIHKCIAAQVLQFVHIGTRVNLANILTKPLSNDDFLRLAKPILFRLPASQQQQEKPPWLPMHYTKERITNSSLPQSNDLVITSLSPKAMEMTVSPSSLRMAPNEHHLGTA